MRFFPNRPPSTQVLMRLMELLADVLFGVLFVVVLDMFAFTFDCYFSGYEAEAGAADPRYGMAAPHVWFEIGGWGRSYMDGLLHWGVGT